MLFNKNQLIGIITGTVPDAHKANGELIIIDLLTPNNVLIPVCHQGKVWRNMVMIFGDIQRNIGWHIVCPD